MVTLSDAADRLGVNMATARRWVSAGRLPAVKQGWQWLVRQDDMERMIAREATGQADPPSPARGDGASMAEEQLPTAENMGSHPNGEES